MNKVCDLSKFRSSNEGVQDWNVLCMLYFMPGGDSYVIDKDVFNNIDGNLLCGSEVNHDLNLLSGLNNLNSFSRVVNQGDTKWKFLRNTHSPFSAASFIIWMAIWFSPPPIASSWYPCLLTSIAANSWSSSLGSEPGDVINKTGVKQSVSFSYRDLRKVEKELLSF